MLTQALQFLTFGPDAFSAVLIATAKTLCFLSVATLLFKPALSNTRLAAFSLGLPFTTFVFLTKNWFLGIQGCVNPVHPIPPDCTPTPTSTSGLLLPMWIDGLNGGPVGGVSPFDYFIWSNYIINVGIFAIILFSLHRILLTINPKNLLP